MNLDYITCPKRSERLVRLHRITNKWNWHLHFSSNHPQHIFTGIIKTETIRYSRLSATLDDYNFIHKLFSLRLTALNYPDKLISEHSFPWLTLTAHKRRLQDKQTDQHIPTVYYKTLYNKDKRLTKSSLTFYANTNHQTYQTLQRHTVTTRNSTHYSLPVKYFTKN